MHVFSMDWKSGPIDVVRHETLRHLTQCLARIGTERLRHGLFVEPEIETVLQNGATESKGIPSHRSVQSRPKPAKNLDPCPSSRTNTVDMLSMAAAR